ncbi:DMT family transporter [Euzebya tangerina]|uniref:DMT family transporter n=1 Tax=Euzebya tangerina TaxID=591198 RepID=UPI0013C2FC08|nr:DMT family transporter [Euzebya tangerina]
MTSPPAEQAVVSASPGPSVLPVHRLLLGVGVLAVSFAAILIRVADAPAVALAFWRSLGGAVVLVPFARKTWPAPRQVGQLLASGAFLALHFALFIAAFAYTSVAAAVTIVATGPIFVGLGAWLVLRRPPSRRTWLGMGVAMVGTVVVAVADAGGDAVGSNPLLGDLLALGGAAAVAGYLLIGQRQRDTLDVATYGVWVYGTSAVILALTSAVVGSPLTGFDATTWWAIVGLIVGPQLLGHTVFNQVLGRVPATTVSTVVLIEPLAAALLALVLLGEVPPALMAVGAPIILVGVYLAATGGRHRPAE